MASGSTRPSMSIRISGRLSSPPCRRGRGFPAVLDFAFHQAAIQTVAGPGATALWEKMLQGDDLYVRGAATARQLPTFISNHDNGRFAPFVRRAFPAASEQ